MLKVKQGEERGSRGDTEGRVGGQTRQGPSLTVSGDWEPGVHGARLLPQYT